MRLSLNQFRSVQLLSRVWLFVTPWTAAHQASLLLPLSCFSRVWLCATPEMAAHQACPSLGFSRQEHWSGLSFPSPMHEKWKLKVKSLSRVQLLAIPWTAAYQAPPSMGFSRQEYWSGVPLPSLPGLPIHHQHQECTQTYVHWVGDAIQPSHPLSSPFHLAFNLSQHQGLFK